MSAKSDADTTLERSRVPGEPGIWIIIFGDLAIFTLFFCTYLFYRSGNPALYNLAAESMDLRLGILNTLLLLVASWLVASAVGQMRAGSKKPAKLISGALVCAIAFVGVKFVEYGSKISAGLTLSSNEFFMFYYMLTGIHLFHVLVAIIVLFLIMKRIDLTPISGEGALLIESGGIFWHLVDILWIVLFTLFYLVR